MLALLAVAPRAAARVSASAVRATARTAVATAVRFHSIRGAAAAGAGPEIIDIDEEAFRHESTVMMSELQNAISEAARDRALSHAAVHRSNESLQVDLGSRGSFVLERDIVAHCVQLRTALSGRESSHWCVRYLDVVHVSWSRTATSPSRHCRPLCCRYAFDPVTRNWLEVSPATAPAAVGSTKGRRGSLTPYHRHAKPAAACLFTYLTQTVLKQAPTAKMA